MDLKNLENNAKVLFNHPNGNFNVDSSGNLYVISQWNFIGRLIKYFFAEPKTRGCFHIKGINQKVKDSVKETLKQIYKNNEAASSNTTDLFYITIYDDPWFDISGYKHTASAIAKKVKEEGQQLMNDQKIQKYVGLIIGQFPLYPEKKLTIRLPGISEFPEDYASEPPHIPSSSDIFLMHRKIARG